MRKSIGQLSSNKGKNYLLRKTNFKNFQRYVYVKKVSFEIENLYN